MHFVRARNWRRLLCVATIKENVSVINYYLVYCLCASLPRVHSATYAMITVFTTGSWRAAGKFTDSFSDIQQITRGGWCTRARFIAACFCHHSARLVNHRCAFIDGSPLSDVWRGFTDNSPNKKGFSSGFQEIRQIWNEQFTINTQRRSHLPAIINQWSLIHLCYMQMTDFLTYPISPSK